MNRPRGLSDESLGLFAFRGPMMAAKVTLRSRLPQVAAELQPRVGHAVKEAAEVIAEDARSRVNIGPPPEHIYDAITVVRQEAAAYAVEVPAYSDKHIAYPFVVEFGGETQQPHPFLIPAAEANTDNAVYLVTAALRGL